MAFSSRPYRDDEDLRAMQDLLSRSWLPERPFVGVTAGDLAWWRWMHEKEGWEDLIRLWHAADGSLAGWAWFQPPADLDWHVPAVLRSGQLPDEMFDWLEDRARWWAAAQGSALPRTVAAWCIDADTIGTESLRRAGFGPDEPGYNHHILALLPGEPPFPESSVPPGYRLRHVAGEADIAARVAIHQVVWSPSRVTEASHRAVAAHYPYREDTDIVVEAPDGSFAAYALGWFDPLGLVGELEPVGTHPDHRRLGLARAACGAAIRRFQELGALTAIVFSAAEVTPRTDGPAARDLYRSMGLDVVTLHRPWRRPLLPAAPTIGT